MPENTVWGALRKSCGTLHVLGSFGNCSIHLGEYLVHAWLDFVTKLQKCTPSATVNQLVSSEKNETLIYLSESGIRHRLDETILDCKSLCVLPKAYNCL